MEPWIQIYSGKAFDPLKPDPRQLDIESVAHSLACVNRYVGHASKPYCVGLHSMTVAKLVKARGGNRLAQLWGLMHDATEAFLNDIAAPVKQDPIFDGYRAAEARLEEVIIKRFIPPVSAEHWKKIRELVKAADWDILLAEKKNIVPPGAWKGDAPPIDAVEAFMWGRPFQNRGHEVVRETFLVMFDGLGGER